MAKYVLPEEQIEDLRKGLHNMAIAKDILLKLRTAGQPNAEAEARTREIEDRLLRFAASFEIDITEE
jgi:hypothetical protein